MYTIKKLKLVKDPEILEGYVDTPFGRYNVYPSEIKGLFAGRLHNGMHHVWGCSKNRPEEVEQAIQDDFERRMLEGLDEAPVPQLKGEL